MSEYGKLPYRELPYRELEDYSNMQAAQIRKKNNKIEQLQARVKELEAINLGLTKTLLEEGSEKARLVEALEEALHHVVISPDPVRGDFIQEIEAALAAYRKED